VDPAELFAWEVFGTLNWGVMCAGAGKAFVDGARSVEGAVIARRASETEFELMRMLAPENAAWDCESGGVAAFDDPPAALIVAEVRSALEAGLAPGFPQKVAANALGIAERELEALARGGSLSDVETEGDLIQLALAKLAVDQPGYPAFKRWRSPAGGDRSP
jgi:hypothetical protein